jgi:hypothetical protein
MPGSEMLYLRWRTIPPIMWQDFVARFALAGCAESSEAAPRDIADETARMCRINAKPCEATQSYVLVHLRAMRTK